MRTMLTMAMAGWWLVNVAALAAETQGEPPKCFGEAVLQLTFGADTVEQADGRTVVKDRSASALRAELKGPARLTVQDGREVLVCDGTAGYAELPHASSLAFAKQSGYTAAVRFFVAGETLSRYQAIISKSRMAKPHWGLWIDPKNRLAYGGEPDNLYAEYAVTRGWHVAVLVQDGAKGSRSLHVDGRPVASGPALDANGNGPFLIGYCGYQAEYFQGAVDEVLVIPRAITEDERAAIERHLAR